MPWIKGQKGGAAANPAKEFPYTGWREGKVRSVAMARILDIPFVRLRELVKEGFFPCVIHRGFRWYNVREVLRLAMCMQASLGGVMARRDGTQEQNRSWAWGAICYGPWECTVAPDAKAWQLYLDGMADPVLRRTLERTDGAAVDRADKSPDVVVETTPDEPSVASTMASRARAQFRPELVVGPFVED